jgi:hypothetical protein
MKKILYLVIFLAIIAASCGSKKQDKEKEANNKYFESSQSMHDSVLADKPPIDNEKDLKKATEENSGNVISSSAAVQSKTDTSRKFIRTADLKFKVKNVYQSTIEIENVTAKNDGFVTFTNLYSTIDDQAKTSMSEDSTLETTYYTVVNNITIRVPNYNLDSTIRQIAPLITYLDYRVIKANDVSLTLAANNMAQKRITKTTQKLNNIAVQKNTQAGDAANIQQNIEDKQAQLDQVKYDKMKMMDEVSYSTLNIYIYQRQELKREMVKNEKSIKAYEPGFGTKIKEAIVFSWDILLWIILFVIRLWAIWLILFVVLLAFKVLTRKKPKV